MPKAHKVAVAALLQAKGVSGSNVAEIIAIVSKYVNGHIRWEHLITPGTALDYARDAGEVFRKRSTDLIGTENLLFCLAHDGTNRGGNLETYFVSNVWEGRPVRKFFAFERMEEKSAPAIAQAIIRQNFFGGRRIFCVGSRVILRM